MLKDIASSTEPCIASLTQIKKTLQFVKLLCRSCENLFQLLSEVLCCWFSSSWVITVKETEIKLWLLSAQCHASTLFAVSRLSVGFSQADIVSNGWMDWAHSWHRGYTRLLLYCVGGEFGYRQKRVLHSGNLSKTLDLGKFH